MAKQRGTSADRKNGIVSPLFLSLFSLSLIVLLFSYVMNTLESSLNGSIEKGLNVTYAQFVQRERVLAREEVEKFIETLKSVAARPDRTLEENKENMIRIVNTRSNGHTWSTGFFIFDREGICLSSHDYPEFTGLSAERIREESGVDFTLLIPELANGGRAGYFSYPIPAMGNRSAREKTAYVSYVDSWGWIVGAGFFSDNADPTLAGQRALWEEFRTDVLGTVRNRLILFSLLLCITITLTALILRSSLLSRRKAQKSLSLYKDILESNLCVMIIDGEGKILHVNDKYIRLTGEDQNNIIGMPFHRNFHQDSNKEREEAIRRTLAEGSPWTGQLKGIDRGGSSFWLQTQIKPVREENGVIGGYIAVGMDITELHLTKSNLKNSLFVDQLTGFGTRAKLLADNNDLESPLIAFYNIDRFSSINRFYGMKTGDEVLIRIGKKLGNLLKGGETLYRIHADTFVVVKDNNDDDAFIEDCRTRLNFLQDITFSFDDYEFPITLRLGISTSRTDTLVLADAALNDARKSSDGITVYSDADRESFPDRLENLRKLNMLRQALTHSRMLLLYQPIINLKTGEIHKYESLIRLEDETGKVISPDNFINLAKEGRLYKKLTHFVIERAFEDFYDREEDFSINLTIEDFTDRETIDLLIDRARRFGIQNRLILEIVETEELRDFEGIVRIIDRLKDEGMRIAIDDFGSGFSNFTYLLRLNADFIKIDGTLIRNILTDEKSYSLVTSIIQFAQEAGIKTIAEYIETEKLMAFARRIGIDYGQGYHIGKPEKII